MKTKKQPKKQPKKQRAGEQTTVGIRINSVLLEAARNAAAARGMTFSEYARYLLQRDIDTAQQREE